MKATTLNDKSIKALKPASKEKRLDHWDVVVPGFGVRVTDKGTKSFILAKRIPGTTAKARRTIAPVGSISLAEARNKARNWLEHIAAGKDPKEAERAKLRAAVRTKDNTLAFVAEAFIAKRLGGQRKREEVARDIRRELGGLVDGKPTGPLATRKIDEIEPTDIAEIIEAIAERAPHQARNVLGYARRFFDYAVATGKIKYSPCQPIKPSALLGPKEARARTLSDNELSAVWHSADSMGYPFGPIYKMLILTGLRLNEVADASWPEFDLKEKLWTIPAERMKMDAAHIVPLCDCMVEILESLRPFSNGTFLFSTTLGEKPVYVSDKIKKKLDEKVGFSDWVNHDIRRTVRTNLSRLPIEEHVRELLIAHKRKGIAGVYDHYQYLDEKRSALELWCNRVTEIVKRP